MINQIYIILFIIVLLFFLYFGKEHFFDIANNIYKENDEYIQNESTINNNELMPNNQIENQFNCYLFGCNTSRNDLIKWIGNDEKNNPILHSNEAYYQITNGNVNKIKLDDVKINKYDNPIFVPFNMNNKEIKIKFKLKLDDFDFVGYISNKLYNLQYLLYQKEVSTYIENDQLYEYQLVKILNDEYKVHHKIPPRKKIENNEIVWFNYGTVNLGPFIFTNKI